MNIRTVRRIALAGLSLLGFTLLPLASAQPDAADVGGEAARSVTYPVSAVDGSGVRGAVFVGDFGPERTVVVVSLRGTATGALHPAHFHVGDCGSGGGIAVPLTPIDGDTGLSVTLSPTSYDAILQGDHYLNVHASPEAMGTIVACGEVGSGATPVAERSAATGSDGVADESAEASGGAEDASEDAGAGPETASYGLFPVGGSGVRGQLQVTERVEGGTDFVVTLVGIDEGDRYPVVLYEGDCGPDRPEVLALEPVGSFPDDPYVSIDTTALEFERIANGDYFLYVFDGEQSGPVVACGEVGVGANR